MLVDNVTLELSGKAFHDDTPETMLRVASTLFRQWFPLTSQARAASVMIWIADGSEILDFTGDLEQRFEWGYWIGTANPDPEFDGSRCDARQRRNTFAFPVKYRPDAAPRSYRWLRDMIATLRKVHAEFNPGQPLRIGATFDNGPEFSVSDFKYRRHREIATGNTIYKNSVICCIGKLHADSAAYAGFPGGIPEATTLGAFLGAQYREFAQALGYDYLWLSNGFGFGLETWGISGALFDRKRFAPEKADEAASQLLAFWRDFYASCPHAAIETRGSNFSAGVEMATDGCPLKTVYSQYRIAPPVNSPWAAINYNSGLEIAAWMSHIADSCDARIPYRFYIHDPWFYNSPWINRYGRLPWDINQPLAVARLAADGRAEVANRVAFMTADNSMGEMPEQPTLEVNAAIAAALMQRPDCAAPLVWVYGFDEYQELSTGTAPRLETVFNEEIYLGEALQEGLPLNTVVNSRNFRTLTMEKPAFFAGKILIVAVGILNNSDNLAALQLALASGACAVVYGSLAGATPETAALLGLRRAPELTGRFEVDDRTGGDALPTARTAWVLPPFADGGLCEVADGGGDLAILAVAVAETGEKRVLAARRGAVAFVRALPAYAENNAEGRLPNLLSPGNGFPGGRLLREVVAQWRWRLDFAGTDGAAPVPRTTLHRHDNAFIYNIFALNPTLDCTVDTPYGAPVAEENTTAVDADGAHWRLDKFIQRNVRCFVRQKERSTIAAAIQAPGHPHFAVKQLYHGFHDAEVRFFPPADRRMQFEVLNNLDLRPDWVPGTMPLPVRWERTPDGDCAVFEHINGFLLFAW